MKLRNFLVMSMISGLVFVSAGMAEATCTRSSAKVVNIAESASSATATIYFADAVSLPVVYWIYTTTNDPIKDLLSAAMAGNFTLSVTGAAASCPTTGTTRAGGAITSVSVNQNR
jgi:DMSO reductase anchor subunit